MGRIRQVATVASVVGSLLCMAQPAFASSGDYNDPGGKIYQGCNVHEYSKYLDF